MYFTIKNAKEPKFSREDESMINLKVQFYETGDEWHDYSTTAEDDSDQCVDYYNRALNEEFGPVADWVDPDA